MCHNSFDKPTWCRTKAALNIRVYFDTLAYVQVGVRDLVARGYVIPGGASQRGGGRAPAFHVARCQTPSGVGV